MDNNISNRIRIEVNKAYYISKRYGALSTFALLSHEKELSREDLGNFLRMSDHFIKIDDYHYFINFSHTNQNDAFKASQNLILYLDKYFNNDSSCIAIDSFDISKTPNIVFKRLQQILKETKKHSYTRIEDENILNGLF